MISSTMSIPKKLIEIKEQVNTLLPDLAVPVIVLCISLASFGLGRLSAMEEARPPVTIGEAPAAAEPKALFLGGEVVASRSGSVYYFPWCGNATKMSFVNRRWFTSERAAQAAGYAPAKNCKGLGSASSTVQ